MLSALLLVTSLCIPRVPRPASMCSCGLRPASDSARGSDALQTADAVFVGEVTSVVDTLVVDTVLPSGPFRVRGRRATFTVDRGWKGPLALLITVLTGTGGSDCGYEFALGQRYLVFATVGANGILHTRACSPTQELASAQQYLLGLGKPRIRYAPPDSGSKPR